MDSSGSVDGVGQGALDQGAKQGAAITAGAMNVIGWIDNLRRHLGGRRYRIHIDSTTVKYGFCRGQTQGSIIDSDDADMGVHSMARAIEIVEGRDASKGEVAATPGKLLKAPTTRGGPRRKANSRDQLVGCQHGGERA